MNRFFKSILICTALITSLSCSQEGDGAVEIISATPGEIKVGAAMTSQAVQVEANCVWNLSMTAEDNSEVTWIVPDKKSAKGNSKVTLKIYANKYNERKATLTFKTNGGKTSVVKVTQTSATSGQYIEENVRVGSFNIRVSNLDKGTPNSWENRKAKVVASIRNNDFDFFGVQEVCSDQQADLKNLLGDTYGMQFFSPYSQDGNGDKAQGLLYKKDKYELSEWKFFWPSDADKLDTMHDNDTDDKGGRYKRGSCCGVLTNKTSGAKVFIMVMHGFLDDAAGDKYASVNNDMEEKYNTKGYPAFFVGDFNAKPDRTAYTTWTGYWTDAYADAGKRKGPEMTFHGWSQSQSDDSRIDYIFFKGDAELKQYVCDNSMIEAAYPSDHFPLYADFLIRYLPE